MRIATVALCLILATTGCKKLLRRGLDDAGTTTSAMGSDPRDAECDGVGDHASLVCNDIGNAYLDGENGHEKDAAKAAGYYQKSCDKGFRLGCRNLGLQYETGGGLPLNRAKAVENLDHACAAGLGLACDDLGDLYDQMKAGGAADPAKGAVAYQKGCDLGNGASCGKLGRHYVTGAGVAKDPAKGISLYEKGCASNRLTCDDLGDVYAKGMGVPVDKAKAKIYYGKACTQGFDLACTHLKELK